MELHLAQKKIANDNHRFRVLRCGRRFGKTTLAILEMLAKGFAVENAEISYIAPTYREARDIAWNELKNYIKNAYFNEQRLECSFYNKFNTKTRIDLRGWESIDSLRGQKRHFLVLDEVAKYRNFWNNWHDVIRPLLIDYKGEGLFVSTPKGFNHFYELYNLQIKDKDFKSFHFTSYDNPHIKVEELQTAKRQMPENSFAQEIMADFRKFEGVVYKEFNRERHLFTELPKGKKFSQIICGVDFGYTNPSCILRIGVDRDSNYWILEEYYEKEKTTSQLIDIIKRFNPVFVYPDSAEPDRIQEMTNAGLYCRDVSKDIVAGIDHVRELFKQNRIHINHNCKNLIKELEIYSYPDKKDNRNEDEKPINENNHACDSLRYSLYNHDPMSNNKISIVNFDNKSIYDIC